MAYDRVADLIQPVHAVKSEPGEYSIKVFLIDLGPVNIENNGQNENESPVEIICAAYIDSIHKVHCGL